ncbi:MAG: hypothetical protein ACKVP5_09620 [Aestuariivirga sp.]
MAKRSIAVVAGVVLTSAALTGVVIYFIWLSGYSFIDECLARGGNWNDSDWRCEELGEKVDRVLPG